MRIQRIGEAAFVFPDGPLPPGLTWDKYALAGPFPSAWDAQNWIVAEYVKQIPAADRELYDECWVLAGGAQADPWILYMVVGYILRHRPPEQARRLCGGTSHLALVQVGFDFKAAAAGDT